MGAAERARGDRVAVVSDVHGNLTAFEAVLADIERSGVDTVVNLGDMVGKGPRGSACVELARERCAVSVQGNWDEWLGGEPVERKTDDLGVLTAVRWWHDELTPSDRAWLRALPFSASSEVGGRTVRFVHASTTGVWNRVWQDHTAQEAAAFFGPSERIEPGPTPAVVCYGDLHGAYLERTPHGQLVNVGSVGNPLDETRASYVLHEPGRTGVDVRFERVAYDVDAEVAVATRLAMPQLAPWIRELREARYRGLTE